SGPWEILLTRTYAPTRLSLFLRRRSSAQSSNRLRPLGRALPDDVLGAIVATARVIGALVLLFFLPGYLLINALYPRKGELDREYDTLYRLTLGFVLSIAVTVFWAFFLNSLGVNASGFGDVTTPNIAAGLIGLSVVFFVLGWWRGAYPWMVRVHPSLARLPKPGSGELLTEEGRDHRVRIKLQELAERREALRRSIKDAERRMRLQSTEAKSYYETVRDKSRAELKTLEAELRKLEEERAAELY